MKREELTALRDTLCMALALPDSVRALLAQWLQDDIPKSNGLDLHPPPATPKPHPAKAKSFAKPSSRLAKGRREEIAGGIEREPQSERRRVGARFWGRSIFDAGATEAARGPRGDREDCGGVADCGRRGAPYVAAVMAELEPDRIPPEPAAAHPPWVRPLPS